MDTSYLRLLRFKPICEIIKRYRGDREVVLFGDSAPLRKILKDEYGIITDMIATRVKENLKKDNYYSFDLFNQNSEKYYIVIPFLQYDDKLAETFKEYGYDEFSDFVFAMHKPVRLTSPITDYKDEYGNQIDCPAPGLHIVLEAFAGNNTIRIDRSVKFGTNNRCQFFESGNLIEISGNCRFGNDVIFEGRLESKIIIESAVKTGHSFVINGSQCSEVRIGKNSLISHWVLFLTGDGHAVFDTESLKRKNPMYPPNGKYVINIGEHVWIGYRAAVLYNTKLGNSSIVGAQALVKGTYPNNCIIAGNPGKMIRKNVTWHGDPFETDIYAVDEYYVKLTDEI